MEATKPNQWIEVYFDNNESRWHWRKVSNRGNLPDVSVKGSDAGYTLKFSAKRAAKRENPTLPIMEIPKY